MPEVSLRKHEFIPFIDTSGGSEPGSYTWSRVDKSKIFALNPNPQTETNDYISYEAAVTEVTSYQPELPLEITLDEGNPVYDFLIKMFYNLPIGEAVKVPFLLCFAGTEKKAWLVPKATITLGELNTVDRVLSFTVGIGGDIQRGTYAMSGGKPTFTPASAG